MGQVGCQNVLPLVGALFDRKYKPVEMSYLYLHSYKLVSGGDSTVGALFDGSSGLSEWATFSGSLI